MVQFPKKVFPYSNSEILQGNSLNRILGRKQNKTLKS